jgi:hypothetical protein
MNNSTLLQSFMYVEKMKLCMYLNVTMKIQQENETRKPIIVNSVQQMEGRGQV